MRPGLTCLGSEPRVPQKQEPVANLADKPRVVFFPPLPFDETNFTITVCNLINLINGLARDKFFVSLIMSACGYKLWRDVGKQLQS